MTAPQSARQALYNRLVEVLGNQEAAILMQHLPTSELPELATRSDIDWLDHRMEIFQSDLGHLKEWIGKLDNKLDKRMDSVEASLLAFGSQLQATSRTYVATTVGAIVTLTIGILASQVLL